MVASAHLHAKELRVAIDPDNAVVKLCAQGMQAEGAGRRGDARALFEQAWEIAGDDYERCIAAHYLARHQDGPGLTRRGAVDSFSQHR